MKWKGRDDGWKTGHVVILEDIEFHYDERWLVQHSCTGELELVHRDKLSDWPNRDEWEVTT